MSLRHKISLLIMATMAFVLMLSNLLHVGLTHTRAQAERRHTEIQARLDMAGTMMEMQLYSSEHQSEASQVSYLQTVQHVDPSLLFLALYRRPEPVSIIGEGEILVWASFEKLKTLRRLADTDADLARKFIQEQSDPTIQHVNAWCEFFGS